MEARRGEGSEPMLLARNQAGSNGEAGPAGGLELQTLATRSDYGLVISHHTIFCEGSISNSRVLSVITAFGTPVGSSASTFHVASPGKVIFAFTPNTSAGPLPHLLPTVRRSLSQPMP